MENDDLAAVRSLMTAVSIGAHAWLLLLGWWCL